jgi:hypothetical protein
MHDDLEEAAAALDLAAYALRRGTLRRDYAARAATLCARAAETLGQLAVDDAEDPDHAALARTIAAVRSVTSPVTQSRAG